MAGAFFLAVERRLSVNGEQIAGGSYLETLPVSPLPFALAEARLGTQSAARAAVFGHAVAEEVTTTVTSDGVEDRAALGRGARESGHESVAEKGAGAKRCQRILEAPYSAPFPPHYKGFPIDAGHVIGLSCSQIPHEKFAAQSTSCW